MQRRLILKYGCLLFALLALIKIVEYQFFSYRMSLDSFLAVTAVLFLGIGLVSAWLFKPAKVIKEKEIRIEKPTLDIDKQREFTARELELLVFLSKGYTNQEIADSLSISTNTVKTHLKKLFVKLDVSNRTQAVSEGKLLKIID